jgi:chromosome segregation ATPase
LAQDNNNSSNGNDVSALKAEIQSLQKQQQQYQDRITSMESQMNALESKADSGTILNTRILSDADGKEIEGKQPAPGMTSVQSMRRSDLFGGVVRGLARNL